MNHETVALCLSTRLIRLRLHSVAPRSRTLRCADRVRGSTRVRSRAELVFATGSIQKLQPCVADQTGYLASGKVSQCQTAQQCGNPHCNGGSIAISLEIASKPRQFGERRPPRRRPPTIAPQPQQPSDDDQRQRGQQPPTRRGRPPGNRFGRWMSRKSAKGLVAGMGLRTSRAGAGTPMMDDQATTQRFGHRLVGRQR